MYFCWDIYWGLHADQLASGLSPSETPMLASVTSKGSQSGPLAARLTELTTEWQLQIAAVSGYPGDMLPPYKFGVWPILT